SGCGEITAVDSVRQANFREVAEGTVNATGFTSIGRTPPEETAPLPNGREAACLDARPPHIPATAGSPMHELRSRVPSIGTGRRRPLGHEQANAPQQRMAVAYTR